MAFWQCARHRGGQEPKHWRGVEGKKPSEEGKSVFFSLGRWSGAIRQMICRWERACASRLDLLTRDVETSEQGEIVGQRSQLESRMEGFL